MNSKRQEAPEMSENKSQKLGFQIQLPNSTVFFAGGWDVLADPTDVNHLILLMQEATKNDPKKFPFTYKVNPYDHLDFILATNAFDYVYDPILKILAGGSPGEEE